jgi:hypothetical protein
LLRLYKIDSMFFKVGLALRRIELEIHRGIEIIPTWIALSIKTELDRYLALSISIRSGLNGWAPHRALSWRQAYSPSCSRSDFVR